VSWVPGRYRGLASQHPVVHLPEGQSPLTIQHLLRVGQQSEAKLLGQHVVPRGQQMFTELSGQQTGRLATQQPPMPSKPLGQQTVSAEQQPTWEPERQQSVQSLSMQQSAWDSPGQQTGRSLPNSDSGSGQQLLRDPDGQQKGSDTGQQALAASAGQVVSLTRQLGGGGAARSALAARCCLA
jgi:hypothetical protein